MSIRERGKYGTLIMKDEEVLLFIQAALQENGDDIAEAYQDMRMIDTCLHMERLHLSVFGHIRKTASGNYRKGTALHDSLNAIIDGRINNQF